MPTSHLHQLNKIIEHIVRTNPVSILDIGVGFGKYGFLSREYLELWDGREKYDNWLRRIDGIEVFKEYLTPVHSYIYNQIYIGNAIEIIPSLKTSYDLILLIDVLEHFSYEDGKKLLEDCQKIARNILISTPKNMDYQKDAFGNIFETHKFQWDKNHYSQYKRKLFINDKYSLICYLGENALVFKEENLKKIIGKYFPFLKYPYRAVKRILK